MTIRTHDPAEATREELIANGTISAPRNPTVHDRRRIMEALESLYDIKSCCYTGLNTDATVANDLDVPRSWVADVRAQFFGDLNVNEEEHRLTAEVSEALVEFKSLKGRLGQMEGRLEKLHDRLNKHTSGARR